MTFDRLEHRERAASAEGIVSTGRLLDRLGEDPEVGARDELDVGGARTAGE